MEGVTAEEQQYVRLHRGTNKTGRWLVERKDVIDKDGNLLSPLELQKKLSLPDPPTHISNANIPKGERMRTGIANKDAKRGLPGGARQFELVDKPDESWFGDEVPLP